MDTVATLLTLLYFVYNLLIELSHKSVKNVKWAQVKWTHFCLCLKFSWGFWIGFQSRISVRTKSTGDIPEERENLTQADSGFSSPAEGAKDTAASTPTTPGATTTKAAPADATTPNEKK